MTRSHNHKASREGINMKFPTIALILALSAVHMSASESAYNRNSILLNTSNSIVREKTADGSSRTQPIKRYRRRPSSQQHHSHRELHPHHSSSSSSSSYSFLCSCSPTTFQLRLDFSKDCSYDTIKTNAGIRGTLCLLGEAGDVPPPPPPPPPPAPSSSQTIPPVMGSETITSDAPSTYYPTFAPTSGDLGEITNADDATGSDPFMPPTDNTDTGEGVAATTPLPTYSPTVSDVAEPTRGRGKAAKNSNHDATVTGTNNKNNKVDSTSLKWIFSDTMSSSSVESTAIPTYQPTSAEGRTPYPTDDSTYSPTFEDTSRSSISSTYAPTTSSHETNLEKHSFPSEAVRHRQLLQEKTSLIGQWKSIPPNDEFFRKFPEWRARQEEIYQLKRSNVGEAAAIAFHEQSPRKLKVKEEETPTSYPTYLATVADTSATEGEAASADDDDDDTNANSNNDSPTTTPTYITTEATTGGSSMISMIPNQLLSAQFLEMDTSPNMNIINQDDQYLDFASSSGSVNGPSSSGITSFTLSYTSISAYLDPNIPLDKQLEFVPGGVILILIGQTEEGEIVRNRVMWTYTMGCNTEDITVEVGDIFGWTMFDNLDPAIPEFCPASSGAGGGSSIPTYMPTSDAVSASSKANKPSSKSSKPHKPSSSSDDESNSSSKSGKPSLSMPSSGDLVDHFDFSKSGKSSSSSSHHSKSSKTSSTHSEDDESSEDEESSKDDEESSEADDEVPSDEDDEVPSDDIEISSMTRNRLLYVQIQNPFDFDLNTINNVEAAEEGEEGVEENNEVFGRRLIQRKSTTLRKGVSFGSGETQVKEPRFDKPLKKRLRKRSV